jgi:hypothetical protein
MKVLEGASVDCVERVLNSVLLIRSLGMGNTGLPSMVVLVLSRLILWSVVTRLSFLTAVIITVFLFVYTVLGITVLCTLISLFAYGFFAGYENAGLFLRRAVLASDCIEISPQMT